MQIINIEQLPDGDEDPIGSSHPYLVDIPEADFLGAVAAVEATLCGYARSRRHARIPFDELAERALRDHHINFIALRQIGNIRI